jgi:aspartyl/asparaginyl beta-hydroxylase (cupin superfamily)
MAPDTPDGIGRDGNEALREGGTGAPLHLEKSAASLPASELALNRLLEAEPHAVLLNIRKADYRLAAGDGDLACYFYRRALDFAGDRALPQEEAAELHRAERALAEVGGRVRERRERRLSERGLPPAQWSPRLRASLDPSAARPHGSVQDPTHHFYPDLPQIAFYDPGQFDWVPAVEAATAVIREELTGLLASRGAEDFRPFPENADGMPMGVSKALADRRDWGVLVFCEQGWLEPKHIERCPRTWDTVLRHAPLPRVAGWGPSIIFSLLKAGAHIGAHTGMYNTRLICHLPLIVPPGCRFRVGDEVREWEEGKLLIFDDTIEHEAWNDSNEDRVMLIFDIWRPELSEQEKRELTFLFSD